MAEAPATVGPSEDDLISELIEEAREAYPTRVPPFIQHQIACAPGRRLPVFRGTESCGPPKTDRVKKVDLVCRAWDDIHKYWTYHHDDVHCFVKGFGGECDEWITFHAWNDQEKCFGKRRVAYLKRNEITVPLIFDMRQEVPPFSASGYDDGHDDSMLSTYRPGNSSLNAKTEDCNGSEATLPSWLQGEGVHKLNAREIWDHPSKVSTTIGAGCSTCIGLKQACVIAASHDSCAYCTAKGDGQNRRCSLISRRTSNARSSMSGMKETLADKVINKPLKRGRISKTPDLSKDPLGRKPRRLQRGTRRQSPSPSPPRSRSPSASPSSLSSPMDVSFNNPFPNLPRPTHYQSQSLFTTLQGSVTAPAPQPSVTNLISEPPVEASAPSPPPTIPQASSTIPSTSHLPTPSLSSHPLTPYILANTTIHISLSTNSYGAVPLLLRDCATLDAFFDAILAAWEIEEQDIRAVVVRFDWLEKVNGTEKGKDKDEGRKGMVLRRSVKGCWDVFLRVVGEAECWKGEGEGEGGRGNVRVEVVVK